MSVYFHVYLPARLSVYLPPACLSVCLPVCLFICLETCLSAYPPVIHAVLFSARTQRGVSSTVLRTAVNRSTHRAGHPSTQHVLGRKVCQANGNNICRSVGWIIYERDWLTEGRTEDQAGSLSLAHCMVGDCLVPTCTRTGTSLGASQSTEVETVQHGTVVK